MQDKFSEISGWVQNSLKPGIKNLRSSLMEVCFAFFFLCSKERKWLHESFCLVFCVFCVLVCDVLPFESQRIESLESELETERLEVSMMFILRNSIFFCLYFRFIQLNFF